jgi:Zn-dependent membrane protease YugP
VLVAAGALALVALIALPQLWVRWTFRRHAVERADFPGTGAELARHLLDEAGLHDVKLERTDAGDHYDPADRAVRLSDSNVAGRSITAVAVAAHEVAHAVQHAVGMALFERRTRLAGALVWVDRAAVAVLFAAPVLSLAHQSPRLALLQVAVGIAALACGVVVHALTLPVELDASFRRALPALERGGYVEPADLKKVRSVLWAAALTYVAAALVTMVDLVRWVRLLR